MRVFGFLVAMVVSMVAMPASAASLVEKKFWLSGPNYEGILPGCDDPAVSRTIISRFARKEANYWNSGLRIQKIDHVQEQVDSSRGPSHRPRRFCFARALTNDGHFRAVSYSINEDTGWIGVSWGVSWCVDGTDYNLAYAPHCRAEGP